MLCYDRAMLAHALTLSIITPSYQQAKYIGRTINSVLSQLPEDGQYIVIDGGSDDGTREILENINDSRLQWLSERDSGQAHAVNKGLQRASGDIIGWLNSDDVYYPEAVHTVLQYFQHHPEVDVVYGMAWHIDAEDRHLALYPVIPWHDSIMRQRCCLSQPAVFFRRRALEQVGVLNEQLHYCMDYDFWLRLKAADCHFVFLPQILAATRVHADTKTFAQATAAQLESQRLVYNNYGYLPLRWALSYVQAQSELSLWEKIKTAAQLLRQYNTWTQCLMRLTIDPWVLLADAWFIRRYRLAKPVRGVSYRKQTH